MNPREFLPNEFFTVKHLFDPKIKRNPEQFSGDFVGIFEVMKQDTLDFKDFKSFQKTVTFLYKRHQNLCVFYSEGPNGDYCRNFIDPEKTVVPFEIAFLNCFSNAPQTKDYIRSKLMRSHFYDSSSPSVRIFFLKTLDKIQVFHYGNHSVLDYTTSVLIWRDFFHFYKQVKEDPTITFEKTSKNLPLLALYEEVVKDYWRRHDLLFDDLCIFLKKKFHGLDLSNEALWKKPSCSTAAHKQNFKFPYETSFCKIIKKEGKKGTHVLMLLFQIALTKFFHIQSPTFPLWKLNGTRPAIAQNFICSYLKEQIFIEPIDQNLTFSEQLKANEGHRRELIKNFNDIDFPDALEKVGQETKQDCFPTVLFNTYQINEDEDCKPNVESDEFFDLDERYNIIFEVVDVKSEKCFANYLLYKKEMFTDQQMKQVIEFIKDGVVWYEAIMNEKIRNLMKDDFWLRTKLPSKL